MSSRQTIGARLRDARDRRFVGRHGELEIFSAALDDPASNFSVLFVSGPPGVGKSTLLRQFAAMAEDRGRRVALLDLHQIVATPEGVVDGLGVDIGDIDVLMLDTYELAAALDGWIRERLVPTLSEQALVVIAGRLPPSTGWTTDPGWRTLMRAIGLRNLRPEEADQLLRAEGVDDESRERVLEETAGHPLALGLYADLFSQRRSQGETDVGGGVLESPDILRALLERFADEVPSEAHRSALEVCAHVRFTTEDVLRVAVDDAAALFDWLRSLSFVEASPQGLFPHDLAREALDSDLRWRDPAAYDELHRKVRRHFIERVRSPSANDRERAATDLVFLHRSNLIMRPFWDFDGLAQGYRDRLGSEDKDALVAMIAAHEGPESANVLEHWIERQPDGFAVIRLGADPAPRGFTALISLHEANADDFAVDPGARAMWDYAQRHGVATGQAVVACRYVVDRDLHQTPGSLSFAHTAVHHLQHMLTHGDRAIDFIGGIAVPDQLEPLFNYIDFLQTSDAAYELDGRTWSVFVRDWRGLPVDDWFEVMADRELGAPTDAPEPSAAPAAIALSQPDFAEAVRRALRDLHQPDRLRANPLLRSRLVEGADGDSVAALASVLRDAVDSLAEKHQRAVDRTFVRPAGTQEKAAEVLDLPFSTYRRHLARGVDAVISALWDKELYG